MRRRTTPALTLLAALAVLVPVLPVVAEAQEATPAASPSPVVAAEPSPTASPAASPVATPAPAVSDTATATLALSASAATVAAGRPVVLTVRAARSGAPLVAEPVDVLSRTGGTTSQVRVGRVTTDGSGLATLSWTPRVTAEYVLRLPSGATATSERRVVRVQPRLSAAALPATVGLGGTSVVRGTLTPAYAGARLQVQRRLPDGTWRGVAVIATSATGAYSWSVKPGIPARYVFRTVLPAQPAHLGAASPATAVQVLALPASGLRQGASGPAVSALERLLLAQKADVGRLDGVFDADLRHALTAFQKSQGLPRTGVYDATTRARLSSPLPVRLRYPAPGRAVEVDLVKQVLYLSEAGRLARIVDISSGNDQPYTSQGVDYRAFTPTGRFRIERKIDGIRVSHLGELYRPAYFFRGWAVHGSPSVPAYPASHGCIRVTNSAQDRLFPLLTVGTPVSIYR